MPEPLKKYQPFDERWESNHRRRDEYSVKDKPSASEQKRKEMYRALADVEATMVDLECEIQTLRDMIDEWDD